MLVAGEEQVPTTRSDRGNAIVVSRPFARARIVSLFLAGACRQGIPETSARGYAQLYEHLAQMPLDGPGAQEHLGADLSVR